MSSPSACLALWIVRSKKTRFRGKRVLTSHSFSMAGTMESGLEIVDRAWAVDCGSWLTSSRTVTGVRERVLNG